MHPLRKYSLTAGLFYLLTFVSIPTLALYGSVRSPSYITGPRPDSSVMLGVARLTVVPVPPRPAVAPEAWIHRRGAVRRVVVRRVLRVH